MSRKRFLLLPAALFVLSVMQPNAQQPAALRSSNPFSAPSTLPFHAPRFDQLTDADYKPALEAGLREKLAEVEKIANNPASPTFENTLLLWRNPGNCLTVSGMYSTPSPAPITTRCCNR